MALIPEYHLADRLAVFGDRRLNANKVWKLSEAKN